jgi:hypothetical protein
VWVIECLTHLLTLLPINLGYAGRYVPYVANAMLDENDKVSRMSTSPFPATNEFRSELSLKYNIYWSKFETE